MRALICGGREYADRRRFWQVMDDFHLELQFTCIIHGACGWDWSKPEECTLDRLKGADGLADQWALVNGIYLSRCPADWTTFRRAAGRVRNIWMLEEEKPDVVIAFPGGPGTEHMKAEARRANVNVLAIPP